jgi:hypothetical protein
MVNRPVLIFNKNQHIIPPTCDSITHTLNKGVKFASAPANHYENSFYRSQIALPTFGTGGVIVNL